MSDNSSRINLFTSHYGLFRRVLCLCWKKVALADPTVKPKGIVLVVETGVKAIDDYMKSIMPKKFTRTIIHILQWYFVTYWSVTYQV